MALPGRSDQVQPNGITGSALPLAAIDSAGPTGDGISHELDSVSRPIMISAGAAASLKPAATFTASPTTSAAPGRPVPTTTAPVLMPVRASRKRRVRAQSGVQSSPAPDRISTAARTARRASSSWTSGTPNTAITASPMYFSTVPPWRSIDRSHLGEVARHHAPQRLGISLLARPRWNRRVHEQDGDRLSRLARRRRRHELSAAIAA